jgi:hypothetical protein
MMGRESEELKSPFTCYVPGTLKVLTVVQKECLHLVWPQKHLLRNSQSFSGPWEGMCKYKLRFTSEMYGIMGNQFADQ